MQRKHPKELTKQHTRDTGFKSEQQPSIAAFASTPKKYTHKEPRQVRITDKVVNFVAGTLQPLSVVETEEYRDMMEVMDPRYIVPSRKHLSTKLIPNKCEDLNKVMCTALRRASSVSVTVDIWSSRQMRSFLGITAHYISPDWELRSAMLACKPFSGRHTAENISAQFEETLTVFDISTKVSHVVSDSASNMRSAFSLPGYVQETVEDLVGDDLSDNEDSEIETDIVENIFAFLPEHDPCFAHTLQLVVKDGLKEAGALTKVIAKASKVVTYVRKSTIATDLLEGEGRLQAANATRWNSEVKMIRSVLKISQQKLDQLEPN